MPDSNHLKDFKGVWGDSCQSMWAELLALSIAESYVISNYSSIPADRLLTDMFHVPKLRGRLNDLRKDSYLNRANTYRLAVIANRLIVLSASFEFFFLSFLDTFINTRTKFFDPTTSQRTKEGDKLFGEVIKIRGLSARIVKFSELAPSKINSIRASLSYLEDVYVLRNVLAHRAGRVDDQASAALQHVRFNTGDRVSLSADELLELADHVVKIARALDQKL